MAAFREEVEISFAFLFLDELLVAVAVDVAVLDVVVVARFA